MHFAKIDHTEDIESTNHVKKDQPMQNGSKSPSPRNRKNATPSKLNKVNIRNLNLRERTSNQSNSSRGSSLPLQTTERNVVEIANNNKKNLPPLVFKSRIVGDEFRNISGRSMNESKSALLEIKKLLEETTKKKIANEKAERNKIIDDDYDTVGVQQNKFEDKEHVKNLDRWRLEARRNKILSSMDKMTGLLEVYRKQKAKKNDDTPLVNIEALNRILVESEDENEGEGKLKINKKEDNDKEVNLKHEEENSFKGIENAIQEGNQELINALVMRKVRSHFQNQNIDPALKNQQLKLQVKMIAESLIMRFKGLKNFVSEVFIQNQVEMVLKKLKIKKAQSSGAFHLRDLQGNTDEEKSGVDYHMIEATMLKNYEQAVEECQVLTARLTELNHQNFQLKKELAQVQDQFKKMEITFKNLELAESIPKTPSEFIEKTPKKGANIKHKNSIVKDNEAVNAAFDYLKSQKLKQEKKKQEAEIRGKINEIQEKLSPIIRETEGVENELKTTRNNKGYYKLQLRDLYFKILKDEKQSKSNSSCSWIIKALWKIDEEVKEQAFPAFMDKHTIKFMLEYSKRQADLEQYCRENGLFGMLSNLDEFKHVNTIHETQNQDKDKGKPQKDKDIGISEHHSISQIMLIKQKNELALLEEFKDRMAVLKKSNLKAKRLVNVVQYNANGRNVVPKWEEVSPFITNDELINQITKNPSEYEASTCAQQDKIKSKVDAKHIIEMATPSEKVHKMLDELEVMRKNEVARIIKENLGIAFDDRQHSILQKTFLFLLGKYEGAEAFRKFLKEKKKFDDKNVKNNQIHKKSQSQPNINPIMLMFLTKMQSESSGTELVRSPLSRANSLARLPSIVKGYTEPSPTGITGNGSKIRQMSSNSKRFLRKMTAHYDEIQE